MGPLRRIIGVVLLLAGAPTLAAAQVVPSPLIAPVVFHWAQVQTAWPTIEGGSVADASVRFWRRQIALFESTGFTAQLFQVSYHNEPSQRNHLEALRQMNAERAGTAQGPPPRIVPFFAAETFAEYFEQKDVLSPAGFEEFYQTLRRFFTMYSEYFPPDSGQPARLNRSMLATIDGKLFVTLWWVPLTDYRLPGDFFVKLNDRFEHDFGFRAFWSTHESWSPGDPDDINYLFNGAAALQRGRHPIHLIVDLLVGFWPPDLINYQREYFVPRAAGATYAAGWDALIASPTRPEVVLIESYNEISEGSHLMPSWPVEHRPGDGHWTGRGDDPRCESKPCHPVEYTDLWGPANPWHYLDLTSRKIREWLAGPAPAGADFVAPHVLILTPQTGESAGGAIPLHVVAADDVSLRVVNLYLDGALVLTSGGSIERPLKTWTLTNGVHRLFVEAFDQAGNRGTDSSDFIVSNPAVGPSAFVGAAPHAPGSDDARPAGDVRFGPVRGPLCRQYEMAVPASAAANPPPVAIREVLVPCLVRR